MKHKIALLLTMFILVSMFSVPSFASGETEAWGEEEETMLMLGVIDEPEDETVMSSEISRMDFSVMLYKMLFFQNRDEAPIASKSYFMDVGLYHWGAGYIEQLVNMGIITGYVDGSFRPGDTITLEEACYMLVRALGYKEYMSATGKSYSVLSSNLKLTDGIPSGKLTKAAACKILYDLMYTQCLNPESVSADGLSFEYGDIFLTEKMGLKYVDGVVDGLKGVSLYKNSIGDNSVSVNSKEYICHGELPDGYLGYGVCLYITEDGREAIGFIPYEDQTLTIEDESIISFKDNVYTYYDGAKQRKATVIAGKDIIYNDYPQSDASLLTPDYGYVTLIDNNDDGKYDVVSVSDYESYVVSSSGSTSGIITLRNKNSAGLQDAIDLNDYEKFEIVSDDGVTLKQSALSENQVITVQKSKNDFIRIIRSTEKVTGVISEIETKDETRILTIGDKLYEEVSNVFYEGWDGKALEEVTLLLDFKGRVAGAALGEDSWKIGYVMGVDTGSGLNNNLKLRILEETGIISAMDCTREVVIDGIKYTDSDKAKDYINEAYNEFVNKLPDKTEYKEENVTTRLVRYLTSDGKIKKLDTPSIHSLYEADTPSDIAIDNSLLLRAKGYLYYKPNINALKTAYKAYMDVEGEVYLTNDISFFVVPDSSNTSPQDKDYFVSTLSGMGFTEKSYYTSAYSSNPESLTADVIVIQKVGTSNTSSRMMVIDKIADAVNDDGSDIKKVYGLAKGGYVGFELNEDSDFADKLNALKKGDVVLYGEANGKIDIYSVVYSNSGSNIFGDSHVYVTGGSETHFNVNVTRLLKGTAQKISGSTMHMVLGDESTLDELVQLPGSIMCYDKNLDYKEQLFTGRSSEIKTIQSFGDEADIILVGMRNASVSDVVVIRK